MRLKQIGFTDDKYIKLIIMYLVLLQKSDLFHSCMTEFSRLC